MHPTDTSEGLNLHTKKVPVELFPSSYVGPLTHAYVPMCTHTHTLIQPFFHNYLQMPVDTREKGKTI